MLTLMPRNNIIISIIFTFYFEHRGKSNFDRECFITILHPDPFSFPAEAFQFPIFIPCVSESEKSF